MKGFQKVCQPQIAAICCHLGENFFGGKIRGAADGEELDFRRRDVNDARRCPRVVSVGDHVDERFPNGVRRHGVMVYAFERAVRGLLHLQQTFVEDVFVRFLKTLENGARKLFGSFEIRFLLVSENRQSDSIRILVG